MKNTIIRNCGTGIEISHGSKLKMEGCIVQNSIGVGLSKMVTQLAENVKSQVVTEMKGLES